MRRTIVTFLWLILPIIAHTQGTGIEKTGVSEPTPESQLLSYYQSFDQHLPMPDFGLFKLAFTGYMNLRDNAKLGPKKIITIVDFRKPSNQKRLWIIDLASKKIIYHTLVSHGKNTGLLYAEVFSNVPNSNTSSLGFYVTDKTYIGKHGLSLYLDGQEAGFNDKARSRAIVMHGADYASSDFVKKHGRLGRSFGCPSVPMAFHKEIISTIKDKTCLFLFYPDKNYLAQSKVLSADNLLSQVKRYTLEPAVSLGSSR